MDNVPIPQLPQPTTTQSAPTSMICPQCHQPVTPGEYYCPNCGKKLSDPPRTTSLGAQIWLYAFSFILPWIGYLAITKWEGIDYVRSGDPKAQQIGWIAIAILTLSSILAIWQAVAWFEGFVKAESSTAGLSQIL